MSTSGWTSAPLRQYMEEPALDELLLLVEHARALPLQMGHLNRRRVPERVRDADVNLHSSLPTCSDHANTQAYSNLSILIQYRYQLILYILNYCQDFRFIATISLNESNAI